MAYETRERVHARWVRVTHWILSVSILTLAFSGFVILMAHPRLYWGDAGNDLTPALIELPISRNFRHGGWAERTSISESNSGIISASRTFDTFNQNGWGRSLHFLAAWGLVLAGSVYLLAGILGGHFQAHIWPKLRELSPPLVWRDLADHLSLRVRPAPGGPNYGLLQKCAYSAVVFLAAPLAVLTGLTMSPRVSAAFPILLRAFGGAQSARTLHFAAFFVLLLFAIVHVVMVIRSGFRRQIRAMTFGE